MSSADVSEGTCSVTEATSVHWRYRSHLRKCAVRCSTVLVEKLIVILLVKKLPTFYAVRRFVTAFTKAVHWTIS